MFIQAISGHFAKFNGRQNSEYTVFNSCMFCRSA